MTEEKLDTRFGVLEFRGGYPTDDTTNRLFEQLDFQRAVQAYLWALPMASYGAMADAMRSLGCDANTVLIADNAAETQQLALTANQDTIYISGAFDLRNGPVVMVLPAGFVGTLNNIWQQPLTDLGGPFSLEQGRGGRYLVLPPDYDGPMPQLAHHVVGSDTNTVVFYVRGVPKTRDDWPALRKQGRTYQQYLFADSPDQPATRFIETAGLELDMLTHEGFGYFESLARYINDNPPRPVDMAMLGLLQTLGIAHGQPFDPDDRTREILTEAAEVGRAMAKVIAWRPRVDPTLLYPYGEARRWKNLLVSDPSFHTPDYMMIDLRTRYAWEAIGTAKAMTIDIPGMGSKYVGAYQDSDGDWLMGGATYRVHLPKDVPVVDFWSLSAYDNETRSLIRNPVDRPVLGSVHGVVQNDDGSFDCYFGPKLPDGVAEMNWIQTKPGEGFFVYLRLYGPEQPWFDKTWIPGDLIKQD